MTNEDLILVLTRCIERLLDVLLAGLAIWFGYKLYDKAVTELSDAELSRGNFIIKLKRVGPGTLFALFGCVVVGYSIIKPLQLRSSPISSPASALSTERIYGVDHGPSPRTDDSLVRYARAINTVEHYAMLGRMPEQPTEKAVYATARSDLIEARYFFAELRFNKDAVEKWKKWMQLKPNDPALVSKLSTADQQLYANLAEFFDVR